MTGATTHTYLDKQRTKKKGGSTETLDHGRKERSPAIKAATHDEMSPFLKAHNRNVHIHWRLLDKYLSNVKPHHTAHPQQRTNALHRRVCSPLWLV
ncbi:hypothetical protein PR048_026792 [Dryococelus australis]|uniref:Uncharacterized protein n=1 Tax=Dryococelus australis TaxID=614101 RepID=A0ABQ9GMC3_9NEOP|nr:hypothetical protein PR048_026792 [Dryococelus australis]